MPARRKTDCEIPACLLDTLVVPHVKSGKSTNGSQLGKHFRVILEPIWNKNLELGLLKPRIAINLLILLVELTGIEPVTS